MTEAVSIGSEPLTIEDVVRLARGVARPRITEDAETRARIEASVRFIEESLASGRAVYGITTGFGASAEFRVSPEIARAMPLNLLRYHGCGTGRLLGETEAAAVIAARVAPLARGAGGLPRLPAIDPGVPQARRLLVALEDALADPRRR
ncbi:MAG: aromatic amino acid lyase, partial [Sandaracinaceae bacterium]